MNPNEQLINWFYTSFQNKDYKGMQDCYADDATFSDPVFTSLNAKEVRAMWEMLVRNAKDLRLGFRNVSASDTGGNAEWVASYTFSGTGRKVINSIQAEFEFEHGKIKKHKDHFGFYKWTRQALGPSGILLGWTPFLKKKVQTGARRSLQHFMSAKST